MNGATTLDTYGTLTEPATLTMTRLLPGPIERVWDYLTDSDLRRRWLASGTMDQAVGAEFELVWRNDELDTEAGERPDGFPEEHRMKSRITRLERPHLLAFEWGTTGGVTFELEPQGDRVLLTLTHARVPERSILLNVSAGWHAHLDTLAATLAGTSGAPFWASWAKLKADYDQRFPGE